MSLSRLMELVGKAEEEGVTLAAMIGAEMSPEDVERARLELSSELSRSYSSIADYMSDVQVPSLDEIVATGFPGFPSLLDSVESSPTREVPSESQ